MLSEGVCTHLHVLVCRTCLLALVSFNGAGASILTVTSFLLLQQSQSLELSREGQSCISSRLLHKLLSMNYYFLDFTINKDSPFFMCAPYLYLPSSEGETTIRVNGQAAISVRLYGRNANAPSVANNRTPYSENEGIS